MSASFYIRFLITVHVCVSNEHWDSNLSRIDQLINYLEQSASWDSGNQSESQEIRLAPPFMQPWISLPCSKYPPLSRPHIKIRNKPNF